MRTHYRNIEVHFEHVAPGDVAAVATLTDVVGQREERVLDGANEHDILEELAMKLQAARANEEVR